MTTRKMFWVQYRMGGMSPGKIAHRHKRMVDILNISETIPEKYLHQIKN